MRPLKNISFFEGEKSLSVNVACQRVTGTGLETLFCTGWWESQKVPKSPTLRGHWRVTGVK